MTLKECYSRMGADYEDVLCRMNKEDRIRRFLQMFLNEESFNNLCNALEAWDVEDAFRAAHSLKGICLNLSLTALGQSANALTEALRNGAITPEVGVLAENLTQDYRMVTQTISDYLKGRQ